MSLQVQHAGVPNAVLPKMLFTSIKAVEKLFPTLFQAPTNENGFK